VALCQQALQGLGTCIIPPRPQQHSNSMYVMQAAEMVGYFQSSYFKNMHACMYVCYVMYVCCMYVCMYVQLYVCHCM
jgi:hypothetical protein